ncbi:hypothetical protein [Cryobacterium soli]|uniref:hypothetical protein n=1 Tax=Cryobacterium soli TaxID=2220095 RepID=UPI000E7225C0|nr:hypothetical protein [Cryobacterium soli]
MGPVFDQLKPSRQRIAALASDLVTHRENRSAGMGTFIEANVVCSDTPSDVRPGVKERLKDTNDELELVIVEDSRRVSP